MRVKSPVINSRARTGWFDRNLLFVFACMIGAWGLYLKWSALKVESAWAASALISEGSACVFAALGLIFAARSIEGLRGRIEHLEDMLEKNPLPEE